MSYKVSTPNSIDLIYLDPPFNKNDTFITKKNKNIEKIKRFFIQEQKLYNRFPNEDFDKVFKDNIASFSDIWTENDINQYYYTQIDKFNNKLVTYLDSIKDFSIKGGFYYLLYMTVRLIEMKRILKDTGSIYYHCDPTFSHYIKAIMDRVFGVDNFRNEIVWNYTTGGISKNHFGKKHDIIFFYSKSNNYIFNEIKEKTYIPTLKNRKFAKEKLSAFFDEEGCYECGQVGGYAKMTSLRDVWKIKSLFRNNKERVGYPTQKPLALLEHIIKASSKEGDIVLDPFCGCATTCIASEKLKRQWIGIDWNKQSLYMIYYRSYSINLEGKKYGRSIATHLIPRNDAPQRTDISEKELLQIENERQNKEQIKKTQKVRMSIEDREIAKELLYEEQAGLCNGCDVYMRSVDLTIDHITPQAQAGDDDLNNLQLLCYRCNNWKRTKDMKYLFEQLFEKNIITSGTYNKQVAKITYSPPTPT